MWAWGTGTTETEKDISEVATEENEINSQQLQTVCNFLFAEEGGLYLSYYSKIVFCTSKVIILRKQSHTI